MDGPQPAESSLEFLVMGDRVGEWVARKATHAADPFAAEALPPPAAEGVGGAIATTSTGHVVAKSSRIQRANNRIYFPVQDCDAAAFTLSEKRWR